MDLLLYFLAQLYKFNVRRQSCGLVSIENITIFDHFLELKDLLIASFKGILEYFQYLRVLKRIIWSVIN